MQNNANTKKYKNHFWLKILEIKIDFFIIKLLNYAIIFYLQIDIL